MKKEGSNNALFYFFPFDHEHINRATVSRPPSRFLGRRSKRTLSYIAKFTRLRPVKRRIEWLRVELVETTPVKGKKKREKMGAPNETRGAMCRIELTPVNAVTITMSI